MKAYRDMSILQLIAEERQEASYIEWLMDAMRAERRASPERQLAEEELDAACSRLAIVLANLAAKGKRLQLQEERSELPF